MKNGAFNSFWKLSTPLVVCLVLVLAASSCSDSPGPTEPIANTGGSGGTSSGGGTSDTGTGGSGDSGGSGGSTTGTLAIQMVDDPTDEIRCLWVYIKDIRVKPAGEPQRLLGTEIGAFELLSLQEGPAAPLGEWVVDAGTYQFIEMLLDESLSYVIEVDPDNPGNPGDPECLEGDPVDLQIPSAKFKVNGGPFEVTTATTVTIDFEAKNSLKRKGSANNPKGWQLNPKVSIVDVIED